MHEFSNTGSTTASQLYWRLIVPLYRLAFSTRKRWSSDRCLILVISNRIQAFQFPLRPILSSNNYATHIYFHYHLCKLVICNSIQSFIHQVVCVFLYITLTGGNPIRLHDFCYSVFPLFTMTRSSLKAYSV